MLCFCVFSLMGRAFYLGMKSLLQRCTSFHGAEDYVLLPWTPVAAHSVFVPPASCLHKRQVPELSLAAACLVTTPAGVRG